MKIVKLYEELLKEHGCQGWWPLISTGYHPGNYELPANTNEVFEVCVGAILAQNTNWNNVQKALNNLYESGLLKPQKLLNTNLKRLKQLIKPSGYYNQKSEYLKNFTQFFLKMKGVPTREELLQIKGVGFETADSILLYAYNQPSFVVDAYTKKLFTKLGLINEKNDYNSIKKLVEKELPRDYKVYQEFHSLIVEHSKKFKQ
jgi:endonuclease-3 related protein